jgi:hypothetical protein
MVCPLRLVLALASVALLLFSGATLLLDTPAGEALARRLTRADRSWWRFAAALFTGELVYAFYGKDTDGEPLVACGAGACADAGADAGARAKASAAAGGAAAATLSYELSGAGCEGASATTLHQRAAAAATA